MTRQGRQTGAQGQAPGSTHPYGWDGGAAYPQGAQHPGAQPHHYAQQGQGTPYGAYHGPATGATSPTPVAGAWYAPGTGIYGQQAGQATGAQAAGSQASYGQPVYAQAAGYPNQQAYVRPATSTPPEEEKKRKRGPLFWIFLILAIVAVIAAVLIALTMCGPAKGARSGDLGQLEGKSEAEIQAELNRVVEEGMFNISIASVVEFASGTSEGELRIENVPNNNYLMRVIITREDTGEQIYETDVIEPNHHIQSDTLDVDLPAGSYDCLATFTALDPETEDELGEVSAAMKINVLS